MENMKGNSIYLGIMTMVVLGICGHARGQDSSTNTSCISSITTCAPYLTTTGTPPTSCCNPLVNVYNTDKVCLCNLLNNTSLINQLQINITQAMELPVRCSINTTATDCSNTTIPGSPPPPSNSGEIAASSTFFEILPLLALLLLGVVAQV